MGGLFDGAAGKLVAGVMARANRAAEAEAIEILAPAGDATVLAIGFGAGVGVALLTARLADGLVVGVDPSAVMVVEATRRNRAAIAAGRVRLEQASVDALTETEAFDGAIAVNSLQLCEPIEATATVLVRVLRPGARLVSLTHDWAMARHAGSAEAWLEGASAAFAAAGFVDIESRAAKAEKGRSIAFLARRP